MLRIITAAVIASVASPYVAMTFTFLFYLVSPDEDGLVENVVQIIPAGTFALIEHWRMLILTAVASAGILLSIRIRSKLILILLGAVMGVVLAVWGGPMQANAWPRFAIGALTGATCGWISAAVALGSPLTGTQASLARIVGAVIVANVAAPVIAFGPSALPLYDDSYTSSSAASWLMLPMMMSFVLAFMSMTVFPVSLALAFIGRWAGWTALWIHLLGGAIVGLLASLGLTAGSTDPTTFMGVLQLAAVGAICGWIYWRIAVGGRPKAPVL